MLCTVSLLLMWSSPYTVRLLFFFFQAEDGIRDVAVTGVQTCALPISERDRPRRLYCVPASLGGHRRQHQNGSRDCQPEDRKSTRLNSSHGYISYAVFCLKKKKKTTTKV